MDLYEFKNKLSIIKYAKRLALFNTSPGTSGNLSVRHKDNFLISASGSAFYDLSLDEVVLIDAEGNLVKGSKKPSSEKLLHTEIYKLRPDINAIVHCHAPYVSAFAAAQIPLSKPIISENVFYFGEIPLAGYALPSSKELVEITAPFFKDHDAVLMANHGIIIGAKNIKEAFYKTQTAETYAQIWLNSLLLDGPKELGENEVNQIYELRKAMKKY